MNGFPKTNAGDVPMEVSELVQTLRRTEHRLQELMEDQVDSVLLEAGQTYMLSRAQEALRGSEERQRLLATTQIAILNALPAHIALLDQQGNILSVNESWRAFGQGNDLLASNSCVGQNYLQACDRATGDCSMEAGHAAAGIRSVLSGAANDFSLEYPCHSPTERRWFQLMVNRLTDNPNGGVVVMHVNITGRKMVEEQLLWKTAFFEAQVNSSHDGILVLDRDWKKILQNKRMVELWNIPQDIADEVDDRRQLEWVKAQVKNPAEFVERAVYLNNHPEELSHDEIELSDGKCIDRHSAPVRGKDGRHYGRIWTFRDITDRKRAEEALRESEVRFRSLFETTATGIAISTPQGQFIQVNPAYCRMLGYTEKELLTLDFKSLTHPDDVEHNLKLRDEVLAGVKDYFVWEKRYLKKNGEIVWTRHSVSAARSPEGEVVTMSVVAEDITERKRSEEALRQSEERLRLITDLVPHGIFAKDAAGRHIFANPAHAEMCGLSIEEILGKIDIELGPDKDEAAGFRADDLALIQSGNKRLVREETRTDFSGRKRFLQTIKVPFKLSESGEPAILGVCLDITDQKRSESRFRRLVESNAQGVFFWNVKGEISEANDAFLRLTGFTREDLQAGKLNWVTMTPPEFTEANRRALEELAAKGTCAMFEKEIIRKDGSRAPILIGAAIFEDKRDEGVAFVLDLTERKKLELQFLRAQRMESIGTLAGGIAHDLNNVLAPILMSIELLKEMAGDEFGQKLLETLRGSAQRGADLVKQVLSFARGIEGERVIVNPIHIMRDLLKVIRDTFPKSIQTRFTPARDLWTIRGDPTQLHQVLLNLCVNARDAMPNGGNIKVSMENSVLDDTYVAMNPGAVPGSYVMIKVEDDGCGIPPAIRERIFEPFFTTKGIGEGTGLGLSTTLAIIKSHGGFINLYSEVGKGTRFKVYLPANTTNAASDELVVDQTRLPRGNGELVLLVDDEEAIRKVAKSTLERFGYRVVLAVNGAEAVAVYAQRLHEIALVLTDMAMPIMDGPSLILALKAINPDVLIIGSSGLASNGGVAKALGAGVTLFVAKPYTAETMLMTLQKALTGKNESK